MSRLLTVSALGGESSHLAQEPEVIRSVLASSAFEVRSMKSATLRDLRRGIVGFRPHYVHFCGHGVAEKILFADEAGNNHLVGGLELAQIFRRLDVRIKCVFLNANNTQAIAENLRLSADHVVSQKHPLYDEPALHFARLFYQQIALGNSVELAFGKAKSELTSINGIDPVLTTGLALVTHPDSYSLALLEPDLISALNANPELLRQLDWRGFEKALAQILEKLDYEVDLQRGTKDGGVDIFALRRRGVFGTERYLIQAKQWTNPVGIAPVREVMFLHSQHHMTKSCLATTSRFTKGAWDLADELRWQLDLRDFEKLKEWVQLASNIS